MSDLISTTSDSSQQSLFDTIRHLDDNHEYWLARELMVLLIYKKWERFNAVIQIAVENLETVTDKVTDHASFVWETSGRTKRLNYKLSRLACYHIALCCDSRGNDSVKMAKHYFAIKTREAEVVIPQQNEEIELLNKQIEVLDKQLKLRELDNTMLTLHGKQVVLALRGYEQPL